MDFTPIIDFLVQQFPIAGTILMVIGSLVVVLSGVDAVIPDEKDNGFMKKVLEIPLLGPFLKQLRRFSIFRSEKEGPKEEPKE